MSLLIKFLVLDQVGKEQKLLHQQLAPHQQDQAKLQSMILPKEYLDQVDQVHVLRLLNKKNTFITLSYSTIL